ATNYGANNVSALLGNGDGTFQPAAGFAAGNTPFGVAAGDVNGDSKLDLVSSNLGSNNVSALLGNGNGTFQAADNYAVDAGPWGIVAADLNGDGKADVPVADRNSNDASVLLSSSGQAVVPEAPVTLLLLAGGAT